MMGESHDVVKLKLFITNDSVASNTVSFFCSMFKLNLQVNVLILCEHCVLKSRRVDSEGVFQGTC